MPTALTCKTSDCDPPESSTPYPGLAGFRRTTCPPVTQREFLYRGISTRAFKRQFKLADYVQVKDASFNNGLLKIELVREIPEAMKPRRIAINGASTDNVHQIESKAA